MPITQITIENFKGIGQRIKIPIRPITLLFGANSSGKSTILQALLYLRELMEHQNADADRLISGSTAVDLGGFLQFVNEHDTNKTISIGVTMPIDSDGLPVQPVLIPWVSSSDSESQGEKSLEAENYEATLRDDRQALLENGLFGINEISVEIKVEWNGEEAKPTINAYKTFINGEELGLISKTGFGASITQFNFNHPIFDLQYDADGIDNEEGNPMSRSLRSVMTELTSQPSLFPEEDYVDVNVGSRVVPEFGQALHFVGADNWEDPVEARTAEFIVSNLMVGSGALVLQELRESRYLGPIRSVPSRNFSAQKSPSPDRWADGTAAWDLLYQDVSEEGELIGKVSRCLSEDGLLNMGYSITGERVFRLPTDSLAVNALQRLAHAPDDYDVEAELRQAMTDLMSSHVETKLIITDLSKETSVDAIDIGSGVSQVIPVLVSVLDRDSSITAIEQPELHIHPAVQCGLGDVFIQEALRADNRVFLVETHSEHLLLRIMKRMRQTQTDHVERPGLAITPDMVSVLFFETYEGRSIYREMPLNEGGEFIKAWPGGFFEEDLDELL